MGNTHSEWKAEIGKPRVVFGNGIASANEVAQNLQIVKTLLSDSETSLSKILEKFPTLCLEPKVIFAVPYGTQMTALLFLVECSDKLYQKFGKLEHKLLTPLLDIELKTLKNMCASLLELNAKDGGGDLGEITEVVNSLHRILGLFTNEASILCQRIDLSPLLLMQFYAIMQISAFIIASTPDYYNNISVGPLLGEYKAALESFKIRWIRERILYTVGLNGLQYSELSTQYTKYFEGKTLWADNTPSRLLLTSPSQENIPRPTIVSSPSDPHGYRFVDDWLDWEWKPETISVTVTKNEYAKEWSIALSGHNRRILFRELLNKYRQVLIDVMEEYFDCCELKF